MRSSLAKAAAFAALAATPLAGARAESFGPVGKSMHQMQGSLMCLQRRLSGPMCGTDAEELASLQQGAKAAATAVGERFAGKLKEQAAVAAMFAKLDAALVSLGRAIAAGDAAAKEAALKAVVAVMHEGHAAFQHHL